MKNLAEFIKDLNENEALRTKFEAALEAYKGDEKNPEAVKIAIAKDFGYEPDENEAAKIQAAGEELNLEDLDGIAGGVLPLSWFDNCSYFFSKATETKGVESVGSASLGTISYGKSGSKSTPIANIEVCITGGEIIQPSDLSKLSEITLDK